MQQDNSPAPAASSSAPVTDGPRYAIYFAPDSDTALHRFGSAWLGRDAILGTECAQPRLRAFDADRQRALTATARGYGFHATLKPPFHLKAGTTIDGLLEAAARFAVARTAFDIDPAVRAISGFLALVQKHGMPAMQELAAACVRDFDPFRAPQSAADLQRRRAAGLSEEQERMLQRWGYPYVMGAFRFHMTLSGRITAEAEREALTGEILQQAGAVLEAPLRIDAVSVFRQAGKGAPFLRLGRFPFMGTGT